jgi:hypothetical protein
MTVLNIWIGSLKDEYESVERLVLAMFDESADQEKAMSEAMEQVSRPQLSRVFLESCPVCKNSRARALTFV